MDGFIKNSSFHERFYFIVKLSVYPVRFCQDFIRINEVSNIPEVLKLLLQMCLPGGKSIFLSGNYNLKEDSFSPSSC